MCRQRGGSSCAPSDADGGPETGGWDAHGGVQKGTGAASDVDKDEGKKIFQFYTKNPLILNRNSLMVFE